MFWTWISFQIVSVNPTFQYRCAQDVSDECVYFHPIDPKVREEARRHTHKKKNHTHTQRKTKKTEINNSLSSTHQRRYLSGGLGDYKSGGDGDCTSAYPLPTLLPLTKELERALPL